MKSLETIKLSLNLGHSSRWLTIRLNEVYVQGKTDILSEEYVLMHIKKCLTKQNVTLT